MSSRKKKKRSVIGSVLYYIVLLAYTVVLAYGASVILKDVDKYLAVYESSQPSSTIDSFMSTLQSETWNAKIAELAASKAHPFQSAEECEQVIRNRVGDDLFYHRAGGNSTEGNKYKIYCGSYDVGEVILKQDVSKAGSIDIGLLSRMFDRASLCPWYVDSNTIDISRFADTSSLDITCPSTYSVMLNGTTVGPEYIVESGIHYPEFEEYYAEHSGLPTKVRYIIQDQIIGDVQPVFYNRNAEPVSCSIDNIIVDGSLSVYTMNDMDYDPPAESEMEDLRTFADGFISPYLNYFGTKNVNVNSGALKALIVPECDIDRRMAEFLAGADWIHYYSLQINSYSFDDAFSLGDGFYVIDMSYDATAYSEYKTVQQASTLRVVVCRTDLGLKAISAE